MNASIPRFTTAQTRLLQETGTQAQSYTIMVDDPAVVIKRVAVLEMGKATASPLVFIHGGNSFAAGWEPLLSHLQNDFHIYAPDRPGCGLTDAIDYHDIPFQAHAVAFVRAVLDGLGCQRVSLVGNSMGGYWSLLFALAYPERVEKLALVGEPAGSAPSISGRLRLIGTPWLNRLLFATVLQPRRNHMRDQMKALVAHPEKVAEVYLDAVYAASQVPGANRAWRSMIENSTSNGKKPSHLTYALRDQLKRLPCPTLFLWGDHDFCSPRWGEELAHLMPQATITILPNVGHIAWLDAPEQVAQLLREFLM